jgi:hypothetical protein
LDAALPRILVMQGIDLHSEFNMQTGTGRMERLVNNAELEAALGVLRGLGRVSATSSQARNEFAQFSGLQSELRIRNEEYRALNDLLHAAASLNDFRTIESRLVMLIAEIESIRGRANFLNSEMGTARIFISVTTIPPEIEEPEPMPEPEPEPEEEPEEPTALQNIGDAFMRSARFTLTVLQEVSLLLAYVSTPLITVLVIGGGILFFVRRKNFGAKKIEGGENNETV